MRQPLHRPANLDGSDVIVAINPDTEAVYSKADVECLLSTLRQFKNEFELKSNSVKSSKAWTYEYRWQSLDKFIEIIHTALTRFEGRG